MIDESKLITKEYLKKFGDKCKVVFKKNPKYSDSIGNTILIKTSLNYLNTFDALFLSIKGVSFGNGSSLKYIDFEAFLKTSGQEKSPLFAEGVSLGRSYVQAAAFCRVEDSLVIYIFLPSGINTLNLLVDLVAYINEDNSPKVIYDAVQEIVTDSEIIPSVYLYITIDGGEDPFGEVGTTPIGKIVLQSLESTNFSVVTNEDGNTDEYYPGREFDSIFKSYLTDRMSHPILFMWVDPVDDFSYPVDLGNLSIDEDTEETVLEIPKPLFNNVSSEGEWVTKVKVENGIVTDVDIADGIPLATTDSIGGIQLFSESYTSNTQMPVKLDELGRAYVDKSSIADSRYRGDLNIIDPTTYAGLIWQHTGNTTNNLVNGYFYKSLEVSEGVTYDTVSDTPYNIGTSLISKLELFVLANPELDISKKFRLYVTSFPTTTTVEGQSVYVTFNDLTEYVLANIDDNGLIIASKTIQKSLLSDILDITIKDDWKNRYTKDYTIGVMDLLFQINSAGYAWKLWNVQPVNSADFTYITSELIDYLFRNHVTAISLDLNTWTTTLSDPYNTLTINASVTPSDATEPKIVWSIELDSLVAVVLGTNSLGSQAIVTAVGVGTCYVVAKSVDDETVTAICSVTVNEE